MDCISSDTNIWFDFHSIDQLSLPFLMSYKYIIFEEALREEIVSPPELLAKLIKYGLTGVELTTEEFFYAEMLGGKYVRLSGYDRTALAIARERGIPLMTGDRALRKAAEAEGVEVFGTIGLLDRMYGAGVINSKIYLSCLEKFKKHPERRLPQEELDERIHAILKVMEEYQLVDE